MTTPTVLVTGFEPFAGADINPSGELARRLGELGHPDCHLVADVLPVSFAHAPQQLAAALDAHRPDILIMLGLAENRHAITPERVAINLADARIPDNDGAQPTDAPLEPHGPAARFTTLPVKHIAHAIDAAGILHYGNGAEPQGLDRPPGRGRRLDDLGVGQRPEAEGAWHGSLLRRAVRFRRGPPRIRDTI